MISFFYIFVLLTHWGQDPFDHSAYYRWLQKPVLNHRTLDDMEDLRTWTSFSTGAEAVVDARHTARASATDNVASISLSREFVHSGQASLLFKTPVRLPGPAPANGRGWGRSGIRRAFNGEDWTKYDRVSFWIYPDLPGFYTTALDLRIYNDGVTKLPAPFGQEGETSLVLRNQEWNHVVWEIGNVARDRVTGFEASYGLSGNAPGEADSIRFFVDDLDLEQVEPDKDRGWDVWPGRIAYSQAGYQTGASKMAIAGALSDPTFSLIDESTGQAVFTKPIGRPEQGTWSIMDFSQWRTPGEYVLETGGVRTQPFPIGPDVWEESIWKALNFFYDERCGYAVPGVHGVCHQDWTVVHNDKRILVNGGWHDAGDLSQGLGNTGEATYGMFKLAEQLRARHDNPALEQRLLEEARWGLDWILKTSFGDGCRDVFSINSRRTDDILGNDDDVAGTAANSPQANFVASAAEAIGARVLWNSDPLLAKHSLGMAEADWQFAVDRLDTPTGPPQMWTGTFDSDDIAFETVSEGILASIDLWKITRDSKYAIKAKIWARRILQCQQRAWTNWDVPVYGFFYADTAHTRILHFVHRGRQQAPILALAGLCEAFPDDPEWMQWYAGVTRYAEYVKGARTAPYDVFGASIYSDTEYVHTPESRRDAFREQVLNGVPLGEGHYLRRFPVWMDYRGHFGCILPEAQAMASAGALRGDALCSQLAVDQLEWIVGKNPFAESAMYGEGYDYTPLYSPSSGQMVGALPVGIQSPGNLDIPYWPVQATWTYKEVWVHPVARWIWLMSDVYGPARVEGRSENPVTFRDTVSGKETVAGPGAFQLDLPEGAYVIHSGNDSIHRTFLPGQTCQLDLTLDYSVSFDGDMVTVRARGDGFHTFEVRADNLSMAGGPGPKSLTLQPGHESTLQWKATVRERNVPWVLVVIPDGDISAHKELFTTTVPR